MPQEYLGLNEWMNNIVVKVIKVMKYVGWKKLLMPDGDCVFNSSPVHKLSIIVYVGQVMQVMNNWMIDEIKIKWTQKSKKPSH
jgi:hypothetical protein